MLRNTRLRRPVVWGAALLVSVAIGAILWSPLLGSTRDLGWTAEQVVEQLQAAGLEVESVSEMAKVDYESAPQLATTALVFYVPSVLDCCSEEPRGFVMTFDRADDLEATRAYYDTRGQEIVWYRREVFVRDNVLLVMTASVPVDMAKRYGQVLSEIVKPSN